MDHHFTESYIPRSKSRSSAASGTPVYNPEHTCCAGSSHHQTTANTVHRHLQLQMPLTLQRHRRSHSTIIQLLVIRPVALLITPRPRSMESALLTVITISNMVPLAVSRVYRLDIPGHIGEAVVAARPAFLVVRHGDGGVRGHGLGYVL